VIIRRADHNQEALLAVSKQEPVHHRRGDQQDRRAGDAQQRDQVEVALKLREAREANLGFSRWSQHPADR
jgi:hypothetical protein